MVLLVDDVSARSNDLDIVENLVIVNPNLSVALQMPSVRGFDDSINRPKMVKIHLHSVLQLNYDSKVVPSVIVVDVNTYDAPGTSELLPDWFGVEVFHILVNDRHCWAPKAKEILHLIAISILCQGVHRVFEGADLTVRPAAGMGFGLEDYLAVGQRRELRGHF